MTLTPRFFHPRIMVAPNGARRQLSDHPGLPLTTRDLAETARQCYGAGADAIHLHVRNPDGSHSLDLDQYRAAMAAVSRAAPDLDIQITTESAGVYGVPAQLHLLQQLKPTWASVSVREIARAPDLAAQVYVTAQQNNTQIQHILYGGSCLVQLMAWMDAGVVPADMRDAILVLGQYAPPRAGRPDDMGAMLDQTDLAGLRMTLCAFGANEQACLVAAAARGCDLRVGFENNIYAPDGTLWVNNAAAVASLRVACGMPGARAATDPAGCAP